MTKGVTHGFITFAEIFKTRRVYHLADKKSDRLLAGGLASYADTDSIKLIRYMGSGKQREILKLSYSDLQGGLGDSLVLQDQDIIFAESSSSGILTSGSGFSLGFLGTGVNYKNPTN